MKADTSKQPTMNQEPVATPTQPLRTFVDAVIIPARGWLDL